MTHPQQPHGGQPPFGGQQPHGGQPSHGGQPPRGGRPPLGGPPPHGGQPPYGGQPPQPGFGGGIGGPPPQPPRKAKTGAIVAVVAAVVLLGALAFTGFVAPGFFLGDDTAPTGSGPGSAPPATSSAVDSPTDTSSRPSPSSRPAPTNGEASEAIDSLVTALAAADGPSLRELACADAEPKVASAIDSVSAVTGAKLLGSEETGGDVVATIEITTAAGPEEDLFTLVEADGGWCWNDIGRV